MTRRPGGGSTLLELIVTLAVMAVVAGVVALALRPRDAAHPAADPVVEARRAAIAARRPVTIDLVRDGRVFVLTALPDGGVIADADLGLDRFTGEKIHEP